MAKTRRHIKNKRKTRKCKGGDLGTNIKRGFTSDRDQSPNYHETSIKLDQKNYTVRYIVPDHLFFKTTNQVFKVPEFNVKIANKITPSCQIKIPDGKDGINVVYIVKIQKTTNKNAYAWYAIVSGAGEMLKSGKIIQYIFYSIDAKKLKLSNDNSTIILDNASSYERKDQDKRCIVTLKPDCCKIVPENSLHFKVLYQFYMQQEVETGVKEIAAEEVGFEAGEEATDALYDIF
jgi:hypothetical protein